jgi:hypothetical protein
VFAAADRSGWTAAVVDKPAPALRRDKLARCPGPWQAPSALSAIMGRAEHGGNGFAESADTELPRR